MGGHRISREDILKACEEVSKRGEKVTNESVRELLGRGSYPTIGPVVKYFKDVYKAQMTGVAINTDSIIKQVPGHTQYIPMTNIPRYNIPRVNFASNSNNNNNMRSYNSPGHHYNNSNLALNHNYGINEDQMPEELSKLANEFAQNIWQLAKNMAPKNILENSGEQEEHLAYIQELTLELDNLRNTYTRLESEVNILRDVNQKLDGHIRKKNSEVFSFNRQIFKKENEIKELIDRCARAEQELQIMKDRHPVIEKTKTILKKKSPHDDYAREDFHLAKENIKQESVIETQERAEAETVQEINNTIPTQIPTPLNEEKVIPRPNINVQNF